MVKVVLSDILSESYMLNPKVVGKVTLQTSRPLTREELLPTLEMLLQVNNASLIRDKTLFRIEPLTGALVGAGSPSLLKNGKNLPSGFQVSIMPLQYVGVEEMQEILKPIISPKAILRVDVARNLLMLAGTGRELDNIRDTVSMFDVDYMQGMSFGIFPLNNVDAETVNKELEEVFSSTSGNPLAGMFKLMPIERLNAILVITPQAAYLRKIKTWISRLDRANAAAGGGVIVYRVQHIRAVDLAETLNEIFSGSRKKQKEATVAPGRKAVEIKGKDNKKVARRPPGAGTKIADVGEVKFIADEVNNSIIIVATAQEYEAIRNVIRQLDTMPLQVLIDAAIFEVRLNAQTSYGISWRFSNAFADGVTGAGNFNGNPTGIGDDTGIDIGDAVTQAFVGASSGGFSYAFSAVADGVAAAVNATAVNDNVNLLSTPSLMVLNNQQASITVGDQVPIRTTESTSVDTTIANTSSIEMRDTGVKLTVTPRVNASGVVIMDIEQSFDEAGTTTSSSIDSPTILQRSLTSSVAVHSGETIVLGGLISDKYTNKKTGIPWLMDIPYLGVLFGVTGKEKIKDELVVLITPRVVQNKQDARYVTREYKQKLTGVFEDLEALKKAEQEKAEQEKAEQEKEASTE